MDTCCQCDIEETKERSQCKNFLESTVQLYNRYSDDKEKIKIMILHLANNHCIQGLLSNTSSGK